MLDASKDKLKLVVGIDDPKYKEDPEGFCSSDKLDWLVNAFCCEYGIPYKRKFVCISVRLDTDATGTITEGHTAKISATADLYGTEFILKPKVIDDIAVVCAGDFQNAVVGTVTDMFRFLAEGRSTAEVDGLALFRRVVGRRVKRTRILIDALKDVKVKKGYAEARLLRPLRRNDCINPSAGKGEMYLAEESRTPGDRWRRL